MSETDWRRLLVRYMAHVLDCESQSYVESSSVLAEPLTEQERKLLRELEPEADAIFYQKARENTGPYEGKP